MEMAKTRPIPENNLYQWYDRLVSEIPESMKRSKTDTKQRVMRPESKNR